MNNIEQWKKHWQRQAERARQFSIEASRSVPIPRCPDTVDMFTLTKVEING